jgi:cation transport regulator ChaB
MPAKKDLPSTIQRSEEHAQEIYGETLDSATDQYGDGERAHRTAFAALKHTHEKVGDSWRPKDEYGPSDRHAEEGYGSDAPTAGGVDANATRAHLYDVATELGISGRSRMRKAELVAAIEKENARRSRAALT